MQHVSTSGEWKLRVLPIEKSKELMYFSLQTVKNLLPGVLVRVRRSSTIPLAEPHINSRVPPFIISINIIINICRVFPPYREQ